MITGGSGYLARRLIPLAVQRWSAKHEPVIVVSRSEPTVEVLHGADWRPLDLLDDASVRALVAEVEPSAIISAAACNPGQGDDFAVNVEGAEHIARAARAVGARLVHVSSDVVHGGGDTTGNPAAPYADDATPTPINDYGRSKAMGEQRVVAADPSAAIVRTSLIYGIESIDRGTSGFIERLDRGERLQLWGDAIRQPVWIDALASSLLDLADSHLQARGTINVAGSEAMSRADFARRLLSYWGVDATDRIDETSASAFDGQPLDLRLDLGRARSLGLSTIGVAQVLDDHARPRPAG